MSAPAFGVRKYKPYLFGNRPLVLILQHIAIVVAVTNGDVAYALGNSLDLVAVATLGFAGQIVFQAFQPLLGFGFTMVCDHGGEQGDVVGVLAAPSADTVVPLVVCQLLVGGNLTFFHAVLGHENQAPAGGQGKPLALGMAQVFRNVLFQSLVVDVLNEITFYQLVEAGNINGHHQICRAVATLALQSLGQTLFGKDHVALDAGFLFKSVQQGFEQICLTV